MVQTKELRSSSRSPNVGLVLSGGGARGAYQAGVVKAISEIAAEANLNQPLPILTGVSAGAINASYLASSADNFLEGADKMALMWSKITADRIFKTDVLSAGRSGLRFVTDATVGALYQKKLARSLLDTAPLKKFINESIDFSKIPKNIQEGHLKSLAITAMNYSNSTSITFVQGDNTSPMWLRSRRKSELANLTTEHIMASSAIPIFFPPVHIPTYGENGDHFGDGCLRNTAPLSPAIHLGADRLLVVSVRRPDDVLVPEGGPSPKGILEPSLARVVGVILNAILLDAVDLDVERMSRVNQTLDFVPDRQRSSLQLRKVDFLWIRPSRDIGQLAGDLFQRLPRVIRYLVGGLGSSREASELTSYLLFDPDFCGQLVRLGYEDAMESRESIRKFLVG
jgi:NTE family protein